MSKSYTDSLDFTHLEGETDDSADFDTFGNDAGQATISLPPPPKVNRKRVSTEESGPSLTTEAAVLPSNTQNQTTHTDTTKASSEGFEDSFVNGPSVETEFSSPSSQTDENGINNNVISENVDNNNESNNSVAQSGSYKIHYDNSRGNVTILDGHVTTRPDGSPYINTHGIPDQWEEEYNRPLRKRRMRLLKIFSAIACVFFFPTGIAALYYAIRTKTEFDAGIMRGNIDRAQKFAKRSERLIILSFVMSFMMGALIAALIERPYFEHRGYHSRTVGG